MPADFTGLQAKLNALTAQVTATEGVEASAVALIKGFAGQIQAAVADALAADNAADNNTLAAASAAIDGVTARFLASATALSAALTTNPPPPPPPPTL